MYAPTDTAISQDQGELSTSTVSLFQSSQSEESQQQVAVRQNDTSTLVTVPDDDNLLQRIQPSNDRSCPSFNISGGNPVVGDQVHHYHGPTHIVTHQHGPQQELHAQTLHVHYHRNLHQNVTVAGNQDLLNKTPEVLSIENLSTQENPSLEETADLQRATPQSPSRQTEHIQDNAANMLVAELQQKVNEQTGIACSQTLLPIDLDRPIVPTRLEMVSKPQQVANDMDAEGHYRKREDFQRAFVQPPGNITAEEIFDFSREEATRNAERVCSTEEAKHQYVEKNGNVVAVVGQPGIGKTTSMKKWSKQIMRGQILPNVSMMLLIFVRFMDFSRKTTFLQFLLSTVLPHWPHSSDADKAVLELLYQDANLVLAFDGLDEAAVKTLSTRVPKVSMFTKAYPLTFLLNLINGNLLPLARKIVTSRPEQLYNLRVEHRPQFIVQILGLNNEGQDELGRQICMEKYPQIKAILCKNPDAYAYCYVPVNFILTLNYLLQHGDHVAFVCLTRVLASACEKYAVSDHLDHLDVPKGEKCELHKLCYLAWNGFLRKKIVFEAEDLQRADLGENTIQSFLTTSVVETVNIRMTIMEGHKRSYFSHLIWQEFFAAAYLMLVMPLQDTEKYFQAFSDAHWEVVSKFAFGLSNRTVFQQLKPIISGRPVDEWKKKKDQLKNAVLASIEQNVLISNLLRVCSWVQEAKDDELARCVAAKLPEVIHISMYTTILPSDVSNLFYVLRAAEQPPPSLRVERCSFNGDSLERFVQEVASLDITLQILNLGDSKIGDLGACTISRCLDRVEILNLFNCGVTSTGIETIAEELKSKSGKFQALYLSRNRIGNSGVAAISRFLERIEKLYLLDCEITSTGVQAIAEQLVQLSDKMEQLDLAHNRFGDDGAKYLLPCLDKVKTIWLSDCGITDAGKTEIKSELKRRNLPESTVNFGYILRQY